MTDRVLEKQLRIENPVALRLAQKLLSATAKHLRGSGFFSSPTSRLQKVQAVSYQLNKELSQGHQELGNDLENLEKYLSIVSDTYPNWQKEYRELNRLIPNFF